MKRAQYTLKYDELWEMKMALGKIFLRKPDSLETGHESEPNLKSELPDPE